MDLLDKIFGFFRCEFRIPLTAIHIGDRHTPLHTLCDAGRSWHPPKALPLRTNQLKYGTCQECIRIMKGIQHVAKTGGTFWV